MGVTQSELARRIGISPSYLNLIERNKRGIAGPLLRKIAEALNVGLEDIDGAAERRLVETLQDVAHVPSLRGLGIEVAGAGELVGQHPGWARAIAVLARLEHDATATARALADRLTHDPFLGETVHHMLSRISAIRSASEIISEHPDISADQRARFDAIIHEESRSLSEIGEALAAYFDRLETTDRTLTALDELEALFERHENHFAEIESAAERFAHLISGTKTDERQEQARALAKRELSGLLQNMIDADPNIETAAAAARAQSALLEYAVGAILAPLDKFAPLAASLGYDVELLSARSATTFDATCRRLTALRPGEGVPRFGYMRANAAGTIIEMLDLPGLVVPRYAAACPLWILYRAQQTPEVVARQFTLFPDGRRFVFVARARNTGPQGFARPRHFVTDMLTMTDADSLATVYKPDSGEAVEEVGAACRMCPRRNCLQRVQDPLAE